jgi:carnitine-CoA ligase
MDPGYETIVETRWVGVGLVRPTWWFHAVSHWDIGSTIPALVRYAVEQSSDAPWLVTGEQTFSYGRSMRRIEQAAAGCRALGVVAGEPVVVTPRNTADYLFVWLGLMEVGAVQVPINPRSSADEVAGFVGQVDPNLVITDPELAPLCAAAVRRQGSGARIVDVAEVCGAEPDGRPPADIDGDSVAVMIPTSGTTGRSKLVMQTHRAYVMAGEGFPFWMRLDADDRLMTSLPLFHINAPAYSVLGSLAAGASLVLLPGFSAGAFLDDARRFGATEFNSIGAMLEILMRQPERPDDADNPIRLCYTGPSPDRARQEQIERRFGFEIVCGYGLSESTYGLIWPRGTRPFGSLGAARQHPTLGQVNEARVREPDDQGIGELELRNPAIMRGYYEMPDETAAVLVDGWLRTGDLVRDNRDGTFTFVGRAKEVIRRRGENLSPNEVEAVLEQHPAVAEAAVIGVPSDLSEEEVKAFVVPVPGSTVDVDDLGAHARQRLARFKVPRYYEVVTDLPHTPTGRLAKHRLPVDRTDDEVDTERMIRPD